MPTPAGFMDFIANVMGIGSDVLDPANPVIQMAFNVALAIVSTQLAVSPLIYELAVYNLAGDRLVNYAQDISGQTYFADLRASFGLNTPFLAGLPQSAADQGTSASLVVPDFMKTLTIGDLQKLRTPWGATYLGFAQEIGPLWGLS
jgi:hypothetical protein